MNKVYFSSFFSIRTGDFSPITCHELQSENVMESTRITIQVASRVLTRGRLVDIPYKYPQTHESLSENVIDGPRIDFFVVSILSGYFSSTLNPNVEQLGDEPTKAQSHGHSCHKSRTRCIWTIHFF